MDRWEWPVRRGEWGRAGAVRQEWRGGVRTESSVVVSLVIKSDWVAWRSFRSRFSVCVQLEAYWVELRPALADRAGPSSSYPAEGRARASPPPAARRLRRHLPRARTLSPRTTTRPPCFPLWSWPSLSRKDPPTTHGSAAHFENI